MRITLITPAAPRSRAGNRATATRWARLLRALGHRVTIATSDDGAAAARREADALIALHAWRSAEAIRAAAEHAPDRPLVVALTGTDIYRFQHSEPAVTHASMDRAHALIGLHARVAEDVPARFAGRIHPVYQSAQPLPPSYPGPPARHFRALVAGHLRAEKDPLRAAFAARALASASTIEVVNVGRAHDGAWAEAARAELAANPRFAWLGEVGHGKVRRLMAASHVLVMSSIMEGGANVVSEACVAGLPVLASRIPGNRGLLGDDYAGYYPPEDTAALRALLERAEADRDFLQRLRGHCAGLAPLFAPERERDALAQALAAAGAD